MSKKQGLKVNNTYKLPIYLYSYNGISIRTTLGIKDWDLASVIQSYNEVMSKMGFQIGDYRETKELWVPHSCLNCPDEELDVTEPEVIVELGGEENVAPASTPGLRGIYPLFGKSHEKVAIHGNELKGCVYYIVSGHGGPDPGAVGKKGRNSLCEDEYAYDVALRLTKNLLEHGATAYTIIRDPDDGIRSGEILKADKDEVCWGDLPIPVGQKSRLTQRSNVVNELYLENKSKGVPYQRMIVIHIDSEHKNEKVDMFFYHREGDAVSNDFSKGLQKTIKEKYDYYRKGRGYSGSVSSRDLHMLRETIPIGTFIELGNIRNYNDQARLIIEGNRQLIADWLLDGLIKDLGKFK